MKWLHRLFRRRPSRKEYETKLAALVGVTLDVREVIARVGLTTGSEGHIMKHLDKALCDAIDILCEEVK